MVTGALIYLNLLIFATCFSHQEMGSSRLTQRVIVSVQDQEWSRNTLHVLVNVLQAPEEGHAQSQLDSSRPS